MRYGAAPAHAPVRPPLLGATRQANLLRFRPRLARCGMGTSNRATTRHPSFLRRRRRVSPLGEILRSEDRKAWRAPALAPGEPATLLASRAIVWEDDPWAKGGMPTIPPRSTRFGATGCSAGGGVVFCGEHTSPLAGLQNGAVERAESRCGDAAMVALYLPSFSIGPCP